MIFTAHKHLVNGDIFSGGLTRVVGENVGEYAIYSTVSNDNYNITDDSHTCLDIAVMCPRCMGVRRCNHLLLASRTDVGAR